MAVDLGYDIDRILHIATSSVLLILYLLQALVELLPEARVHWSYKRYSVRWTAHRFGPLACLLHTISGIDWLQVYGIFTPRDKIAKWLFMFCVWSIYFMAFSACYTVIETHSRTARVTVSVWFTRSLIGFFVLTPLVIIALLAIAYSNNEEPRIAAYFMWLGLFGLIVWCLFAYHGWKLRAVLKAGVENPQATPFVRRSFERISRSMISLCFLLGVANLFEIVSSAIDWDSSHHTRPNPEKFEFLYLFTDVIIFAALCLCLWVSWIPLKRKPCGAGPCGLPVGFAERSVDADSSPHQGSDHRRAQSSGAPASPTSSEHRHPQQQNSLRLDIKALGSGNSPATEKAAATNTITPDSDHSPVHSPDSPHSPHSHDRAAEGPDSRGPPDESRGGTQDVLVGGASPDRSPASSRAGPSEWLRLPSSPAMSSSAGDNGVNPLSL